LVRSAIWIDNNALLSIGEDGKLKVWETVFGREVKEHAIGHGGLRDIRYHGASRRLAIGCGDGSIRLCSVGPIAETGSLANGHDAVTQLSFFSGGTVLSAVDAAGRLSLYAVDTRLLLEDLPADGERIESARFHPKRPILAIVRRGQITLFELAIATLIADATRPSSAARAQPWRLGDGAALLGYVRPDLPTVQDQVNRLRMSDLFLEPSREISLEICRRIYDDMKRLKLVYDVNPELGLAGKQLIRSVMAIHEQRRATCVDIACYFAALLEASHQQALIAIVRTPQLAHALVGYRAPLEPAWRSASVGDLRRAVLSGDAVLFEPTGVLASERIVAGEEPGERNEGQLDFDSARRAAERLIEREDLTVQHLIDVSDLRLAKPY
jgi:hypothetical protein